MKGVSFGLISSMLLCQERGNMCPKTRLYKFIWSLWQNIVPNTISLMVTSKYLKISTNTMRRIEVFMGLNLYKIKRKTNILLISWHEYFYQMGRGKRNFAKTANKWPKTIIPYTIDKSTIGKTFKTACYI